MRGMSGIWPNLRRPREDDEFASPAGDPEWRELLVRYVFRLTAAFLLLFGAVSFAFWWSGSAVRFGASRAAGQASPTWRVEGVVRDAITYEPIPWARVEDDPGGRPPLFQTDADQRGSFALLTLPEPHRVQISAPNYRTARIQIGRAWYLWAPKGEEKREFRLVSESLSTPNQGSTVVGTPQVHWCQLRKGQKGTCMQQFSVVDSSWLD
jgi:hypothetical protein